MAAAKRVEKSCVRTGSVVRELDGVSWIANSYGTVGAQVRPRRCYEHRRGPGRESGISRLTAVGRKPTDDSGVSANLPPCRCAPGRVVRVMRLTRAVVARQRGRCNHSDDTESAGKGGLGRLHRGWWRGYQDFPGCS